MRNLFTYKGFSTSAPEAREKRQWKLFNRELIQRDLLNHINTRMGERLGRPSFGCEIWQYFMGQNVSGTGEMIKDELERVCRADPRIIFYGITLTEIDHGVIAAIELGDDLSLDPYIMMINFDERQGLATKG